MNDINILESNLDSYYSKKNNIIQLHEILNDKNTSLRVIDWFVTNFSKKYSTYYNIYSYNNKYYKELQNTNIEYKLIKFNIYSSYKSHLKSYSKKNFDPFCRRKRLNKKYLNYNLETTLGQLNFFKWCIDFYILDFIKKNYAKIEKDMNDNIKINNKSQKKPQKRTELSKSIYNGLNKIEGQIILYFD